MCLMFSIGLDSRDFKFLKCSCFLFVFFESCFLWIIPKTTLEYNLFLKTISAIINSFYWWSVGVVVRYIQGDIFLNLIGKSQSSTGPVFLDWVLHKCFTSDIGLQWDTCIFPIWYKDLVKFLSWGINTCYGRHSRVMSKQLIFLA